jgi:hypothetical protein
MSTRTSLHALVGGLVLASGQCLMQAGAAEVSDQQAKEAEISALIDRALNTPAIIRRDGDVVVFDGYLNVQNGEKLIGELRALKTRRVVFTSPGGLTEVGRRVGTELFDQGIDVEITGACDSSCANYIFPAGKRKFINRGGIVRWHGNSSQKDFRERVLCGRSISSFSGETWSVSEATIAASKESQMEDLAFYRHIGVDDYIARVGQEPDFLGRNFTVSIADMALFGIRNVTAADKAYGTKKFCKAFTAQNPKKDVYCLKVTANHLAYELARRAQGETCTTEGTLKIRESNRNKKSN